jgi:diguanylate cyclase
VWANISSKQFSQTNLIKIVVEALEEPGLRPEGLMLEIPEQVFAGEAEPAVTNLRVLKGLKVHVVIDNFGPSYSSFSYLKRSPLTRVKLDRSPILRFSQKPQAAAVVAAIIDLAHALNRAVIGYGVETAGRLPWLRELGCGCAQGYYFLGPVKNEEVRRYSRLASTDNRVVTLRPFEA